ncbi:hypothetical protein I4U23_010975 [Adineta vaga]|nr:hypothetical protein I4U23_010975 [Adineta vaga]
MEVLRNIAILFSIYILGGLPWGLYIVTKIELLYSCSIVSTTLTVAIEKAALIALNRKMRNSIKKRFLHLTCRLS